MCIRDRSKIISGEEQPKPEQIAKGQEIVESLNETELLVDDEEEGEKDAEEEQMKGIPSFWLTALENLPIVCDTITDRDAQVLELSLIHISVRPRRTSLAYKTPEWTGVICLGRQR